MLLPLLILIMFLVAPGLGLVLAEPRKEFGEVGSGILVAYAVHTAIVLGIVFYMTVKSRRRWKQQMALPAPSTPFLETVFSRGALALLLCSILVFSMGGYQILFLGAKKGDVRTSLGAVGFVYAWTLRYFCPALLAYLAYAYKTASDPKRHRKAFMICFFLATFTGLMTGTKFTTVMLLLPGVSILIGGRGMLKICGAGLVGSVLVVSASMLHEGRTFKQALEYSAARATVVAGYGARCCWNGFAENPTGMSGFEGSAGMLGGAKLASAATGIAENDIRFLQFNPPRYITYLYYPNTDDAVGGETNLTLTSFGEALYFWGRHWYWVWSILAGLLLGTTLNWYTFFFYKGRFVAAALVLTYYFSFLISWTSSGDWAFLFGLPTIVGYVLLRYAFDIFLPAPMGSPADLQSRS